MKVIELLKTYVSNDNDETFWRYFVDEYEVSSYKGKYVVCDNDVSDTEIFNREVKSWTITAESITDEVCFGLVKTKLYIETKE